MTCDAKIKPFPDFAVIPCEEKNDGHTHHRGVLRGYAGPGSETAVEWAEDDRRTFRGDWVACLKTRGCIFPAGHPRLCAT